MVMVSFGGRVSVMIGVRADVRVIVRVCKLLVAD